MNFSEQPPSQQWAVLKFRGERLAEVWFKPEEEPNGLRLRIPQSAFQLPGIGQRLTPELLLRAVGISTAEIEYWRHDGGIDSDTNSSDSELDHSLPPPPPDVNHVNLYVTMKLPPPPVVVPAGHDAPEITEAQWHYLAERWDAILTLEASVDSLRLSVEGLRAEMEAAANRALNLEEKTNAASADLVFWNKAKSRVRYATPKLREWIHRATWAKGAAERKAAEEHFANYVLPRIPTPQLDQIRSQFDSLLKNRQILSAQGVSAHQEGRRILSEVESALRTLQRNAAANAARKKNTTGRKGKW